MLIIERLSNPINFDFLVRNLSVETVTLDQERCKLSILWMHFKNELLAVGRKNFIIIESQLLLCFGHYIIQTNLIECTRN